MNKSKFKSQTAEVIILSNTVVETLVNKGTLSLAAVAVFTLNVFGVNLGDHDLFLGLALLAGSRVVE